MREEYIIIRENIFNAIKNNTQPSIPVDFFYRYYLQEFENLPKSRKSPVTDSMGNIIFDKNGDITWIDKETKVIPYDIFIRSFSSLMMMDTNSILEYLDKKFEINWLEKDTGNLDMMGNTIFEKIKLVI
jgi:hypothetical protein